MKAFPLSNMTGLNQQGMDLRDYFAAAALQSLILADTKTLPADLSRSLSKASYEMADAMLKAREEK